MLTHANILHVNMKLLNFFLHTVYVNLNMSKADMDLSLCMKEV